MTTSNLPILLFVVPFVAALLSAAGGWLVRGSDRWIALGGLLVTAALAVASVPRVLSGGSLHTHLGNWPPPIGIEVLLDPLSAIMSALVAVVALIVVAGSVPQVSQEMHRRETVYYATVMLLVSGLMGMVVTGDLFNLFVQLEVAALSAYALVAAGGRGAPRAGLNYLIIGTLGASLYLMGVGFIYGATGSLNMADIATLLPDAEPRLVLVGGLLIVAGMGVKMALFPLHMWMPAAYARAPVAAAALMAPLVTKVSAYVMVRVIFWVFGTGTLEVERVLLDLLAYAGAAAMVAGGLLALAQQDLRRLLAYSSIGQLGIVALGIGLASTESLTGAVLHIGNDALMKATLFLAAGMALLRFDVRNVSDLSRLRGRAPWSAAAMTIAGLSLIGVPPLAGFFGKWYVLNGALAAGRWPLAAALVLSSLATVGYVFRILERLYFATPAADDGTREGSAPVVVACVTLAALIILLGLMNERVVSVLILPSLPALPVMVP
ncbi:monovalent cation/H+ antiporter subunit D family protein [soil metagenome]